MNDKIAVDLTQAISALNKTLMLQYQSKTTEDANNQKNKRRKDVPLVKLSDSGPAKEIRGLLADMYKELQALNLAASKGKSVKGGTPTANTEAARRLTGALNNLTKTSTSLDEVFKDLGADVDDAADGFDRLSRIQQELIRQQTKTIGGYNHLRQEMGKFSSSLRNGGGGNGGGGNGGGNNNSPTPSSDDNSSGSSVGNLLDGILKSFKFSDGVKGALSDAAIASRTGSSYNPIDTTIQASSMGMAVKDFLEFGAQFRTQAMRLTGGMDQWMQSVKTSQMDLLAYTGGDMVQAAQVYGNMAGRFMNLGFGIDEVNRMIGSGSGGYVGTLKKLTHATGQSIDQLDDMMGSLFSSDIIRDGMLKLDREGRRNYLNNQTTMMHNMTMVTGSLDRARQIVDQMNKRQSLTAVDRLRESAKTSVVAQAMGMSSVNASEYAKLLMMRPEQMNTKQTERLRQLEGEMSSMYEGRVGSGNFALEAIAQAMVGQTKLDMQGKSVMNTTLDQSLNGNTIAKQQNESFTTMVDTPKITELVSLARVIQQSLGSNLANIIIGGFASILAAMGAKGLFDYRRGGSAGRAPTPGAPTPPAPPAPGGANASTWSKVKGLAKGAVGKTSLMRGGLAGAAAYAGFYALDKVWQPETAIGQTAKHYMNEASTATSIGMAIGTAIAPGIGTAIGGLAGAAIGVMMADPPSQIKQYSLAAEKLLSATEIELGMVNRRHQIQLNNLDKYMVGMTENNRAYFQHSIAAIEKEYGVKITSVNDLNKYADQSLRAFMDKRNGLLQKEHALEMDAIKFKRDQIQRNLTTMKDAQKAVDLSEQIKNTDITDFFSAFVDGDDMKKITNLLNPDLTMMDTLIDSYGKIDADTMVKNGFTDQTLETLLRRLEAGDKSIAIGSKEGKLAQALHGIIASDAAARAEALTNKATNIHDNSKNNALDSFAIRDMNANARKGVLQKLMGGDVEQVVAQYNKTHQTSFTPEQVMSMIAKDGQTYVPELDSMLFKSATTTATSAPRLFDIEASLPRFGDMQKNRTITGKIPSETIDGIPPTSTSENLTKATDNLLAVAQKWSSDPKTNVMVPSPELTQEMQRMNMSLVEVVQLLSEQLNKTQSQQTKSNIFRGPLVQ